MLHQLQRRLDQSLERRTSASVSRQLAGEHVQPLQSVLLYPHPCLRSQRAFDVLQPLCRSTVRRLQVCPHGAAHAARPTQHDHDESLPVQLCQPPARRYPTRCPTLRAETA